MACSRPRRSRRNRSLSAPFQRHLLYIANSLVDQHIGLEETDDGIWSIYFNTILLATLDERDYIIGG